SIWEVLDGARNGFLEAMKAIACAKLDDEAVASGLAVVLVALECARKQVNLGERIGEAARDLLLGLEPAAEDRNRHVRDKREVERGSAELAIPFGCAVCLLG